MAAIPRRLRRLVISRAGNRCEYCGLSQAGQSATFHIDHIIPVTAGGETADDNLALACVACSLRKSARLIAPDPDTRQMVAIFHPGRQRWIDHFRWEGVRIVGLTATGRATLEALAMNRVQMLEIRHEEAAHGRHPPP